TALRLDGHSPDAPSIGLSLLEVSHRGAPYQAVHDAAIELAHRVLGIPEDTHQILLLPGGASMQFVMVPTNLSRPGKPSSFVDTGAWSTKAIAEARHFGDVRVLGSSSDSKFDHIPTVDYADAKGSSFLHLTTNNTIYGTEYADIPRGPDGVPLVIDASSHIGSRPMALAHADLGYAGAQKNLGCSGLCLVYIRRDLIEAPDAPSSPKFLKYATHAKANSLFNTPNSFGVLVLKLVLEWVESQGGVEAMGRRNREKSELLYTALDKSSLFEAHAKLGHRSQMTIPFTLAGAPDAERDALTARFLDEAAARGLQGLKGHRSVGGCRASMYNAFPVEGARALVAFIEEFERGA
ncbi:MAG: 3-phosphoserine/phosphohydroxythreonine transaminase, partial [Nannocystaceae bacterium]